MYHVPLVKERRKQSEQKNKAKTKKIRLREIKADYKDIEKKHAGIKRQGKGGSREHKKLIYIEQRSQLRTKSRSVKQ